MSRRADDGPDDDEDDEFSDEAEEDNRGGDHRGGDDDFDEFEESVGAGYDQRGGSNATAVPNAPYDEAVELSESEGGESNPSSPAVPAARGGPSGASRNDRARADAIDNQPFDEAHDLTSEGSVDDGDDDDDDGGGPRMVDADPSAANSAKAQMASSQGMGAAGGERGGNQFGSMRAPRDQDEDEDDHAPQQRAQPRNQGEPSLASMANAPKIGADDDDGEGYNGGEAAPPEGMYDPAEYASLPVSAEISELFQYITRYKPHNIELETKMRPFIPDYIPAVGDIDPFIKVPRPDGKADNLGLVALDEPASIQSDPTVLTLQLRAVSKSSGAQPMLVRSVENAEKDSKAITGWINSISDLHRHKPAPSVRYSKPMPDIEALMQIWPAPIEELLESNPLPDADINLDLASYVRVVCGMLDIPVYGSLTEALHVLFTLYSDFKANVHFQQQLANEGGGGYDGGMGGDYGEGYGNAQVADLS